MGTIDRLAFTHYETKHESGYMVTLDSTHVGRVVRAGALWTKWWCPYDPNGEVVVAGPPPRTHFEAALYLPAVDTMMRGDVR